jgi:membrane-associated phospholipid phosphatase
MNEQLQLQGPDRYSASHSRSASTLLRRLGNALAVACLMLLFLSAMVWLGRIAAARLGVQIPVTVLFVLALVCLWLLVRTRRWWGPAFEARFPRLALAMRTWLPFPRITDLTLALAVIALSALTWFLDELAAGTDQRLLNVVVIMRTASVDTAMFFATFLESIQTLVVVTAISLLVALLMRHRKDALLLVLAALASTLLAALLQVLLHRPLPPQADARIIQGAFGFPSGPAAISAALYGTLAYLLLRGLRPNLRLRGVRPKWLRVILGTGATLLMTAIAALPVVLFGVSGVYLGLQFPSDVLAGWAVGLLCLLLVIIAEDWWPPPGLVQRVTPPRRVATIVTTMVLLALGVAYVARAYQGVPPAPPPLPPTQQYISWEAVPTVVETQLPPFTEGLFGKPQEPISLIFLATRAELEDAFVAAGWIEAQPLGFASLAQAAGSVLTQHPDPTGPLTPSFWDDQPEDLASNLPVGNTLAVRHHIRIWHTADVLTDGRPLWMATASLDRGYELSPIFLVPTHAIAPNIDAERQFTDISLVDTRQVTSEQTIQLVPPESGHNFGGDPFFTDGQAIILVFSQPHIPAW